MRPLVLASTLALIAAPAFAQDATVKMYEALETGQGKEMEP